MRLRRVILDHPGQLEQVDHQNEGAARQKLISIECRGIFIRRAAQVDFWGKLAI